LEESVDSKVLPDGALADLQNGRLHRAGDLRLRRGWRPLDMSVVGDDGVLLGTDYVVTDLYSADRGLVALGRVDSQGLALQSYTQHSASVPWVRRRGMTITPVTSVRSVGNQPDREANVYRASAAVTSDGVWGAVLLQTTTRTTLRVFRMATDETVFYDSFAGVGDDNVRKIVSLGSTFGIVRYSGTALQLQAFNPAASSNGLGANTTLVTATVTQFDVATAPETTPGAVHLVYVVAGEISYAKFTTAGVQVGSTKQVLAAGGQAAYVASDDVTAHVVYQATATGELSLLSFAATGAYTTSAGPTALDAGQSASTARFAIGLTTEGTDHIFVAASSTGSMRVYTCTTAHAVTEVGHGATELVSGWVTGRAQGAVGVVRGVSGGMADAALMANDKPWFVAAYGLSKRPSDIFTFTAAHQPYSPGRAPTGDVLMPYNRVSDASVSSNFGDGAQATLQTAVRAFRLFDTAARPGVAFAGALYIAGGMLTQFIGGGVAENGLLRPVITAVTPSNGSGSVGAGSYLYRTAVTWTDEAGRVHRSIVSYENPEPVTAPDDTVALTVQVPKTLRRDPNLVSNPVAEAYRTEAGPGELFYLVGSAVVTATADDAVTITDLLADASIIDNKRLYTEGELGAVSGALDVAPGIPSRYVAAVRDRLVLAGADTSYQFSQTALPEEPVCFTQPGVSGPVALSYQDAVEGGAITGLATLDDTVILGTATGLFVTAASGDGPNLAGVGEFPSPSRMPSDVGIYSAASLVEDAAGLWFLAAADKLFVLPRGQATPVWAGQSVQVRLAAGAVVGAAREIADDLTVWGLGNATTVWRTVDDNQWGRDTLPFTPARFIGHAGGLYAVDSTGNVWAQDPAAYGDGTSGATAVALTATTGDVQVFGQAGHGRVACIELLGEFQTAAAVLAEISYDLGQTWVSMGSHTVTGLSAGQAFQRQWYPARQRGGKFRLRFTMTPSVTTAEGCRLTGFSVYFDQRSGPTRLDSAKRR
jgi:hypothetical protein